MNISEWLAHVVPDYRTEKRRHEQRELARRMAAPLAAALTAGLLDRADKSWLRQPIDQRASRAEKLRAALAYLGENWCLANPSTLVYRRAEIHVPNLAGRALSEIPAVRRWWMA